MPVKSGVWYFCCTTEAQTHTKCFKWIKQVDKLNHLGYDTVAVIILTEGGAKHVWQFCHGFTISLQKYIKAPVKSKLTADSYLTTGIFSCYVACKLEIRAQLVYVVK